MKGSRYGRPQGPLTCAITRCWRLLQNTDAGTMSPFEHGEVFVLDDGASRRQRVVSGAGG